MKFNPYHWVEQRLLEAEQSLDNGYNSYIYPSLEAYECRGQGVVADRLFYFYDYYCTPRGDKYHYLQHKKFVDGYYDN